MNIDPRWAGSGRRDTERYGYTYAEVIAVIYSATSMQFHVPPDIARIYYVGGTFGRVLVVTADREFPEATIYSIVAVRPATAKETHNWEVRQ